MADPLFSVNEYPTDGVQTNWEVNFAGGYISQEHVTVRFFNSAGDLSEPTFTWIGPFSISITPALEAGGKIRIYRTTPANEPLVNFSDGSVINEATLDLNAKQAVFLAAEVRDVISTAPELDDILASGQIALDAKDDAIEAATDAQTAQAAAEAAAAASEAAVGALADPDGSENVGHTTAGGITTTVDQALNWGWETVKHFGAVGDGVADDTAAIQAMITARGYFVLDRGTFRITDSLIVPGGGPYGMTYRGASMEGSALFCDGLTGKAAIKPGNLSSLYRVSFRDFKIYGDADSAIDFDGLTGSNQFYASEFRNLWLQSEGDDALRLGNNFSVVLDNVHCFSDSGHSFHLKGDIVRLLTNCYAHKAGPGKAGYRIWGQAELISCNGLDEGDIWGDFGATVAQDGVNVQFHVTIQGGNMEDFAVKAVRLRYTGNLQLHNVGFVPGASGSFVTLIDHSEYGAAGLKLEEHGCYYASKGATMSGPSRVLTNSAPTLLHSSGVFSDIRRTDQSLTYPFPRVSVSNAAFQVYAHNFDRITWTRAYGYVLQVPALWTVNAPEFSAANLNTVRTANTSATSIRLASGGEKAQRLTIIIEDANTTIQHNYASNGRFLTTSGADIVCAAGDVYEFVHNGTNWVQV